MSSLKATLRQRDSRLRRTLDGIIIGLILLSLVTFAVETLPDLQPWARHTLQAIEVITVLIFTVEYLGRVWLAEKKRAFIFSFFGIIDLLAILPFYLYWIHVDLRGLRSFRLIRLVRILKLARYNHAIQRFHRALAIAREELILFFCVAILLLYLTAVGIYHFEHRVQPDDFKSVFHGLWWALVTLTTVGYGDVVPITAGGRFFTFVLLMIGLGVFSVPAGLLASALSAARLEEDKASPTPPPENQTPPPPTAPISESHPHPPTTAPISESHSQPPNTAPTSESQPRPPANPGTAGTLPSGPAPDPPPPSSESGSG